mmetsp:Transcript_30067/g.46496  ORF Transcript_30067/g.46496 Transcript_30067/m.46496 type:complete len:201 (+) Transcript_30067:153-755(+)
MVSGRRRVGGRDGGDTLSAPCQRGICSGGRHSSNGRKLGYRKGGRRAAGVPGLSGRAGMSVGREGGGSRRGPADRARRGGDSLSAVAARSCRPRVGHGLRRGGAGRAARARRSGAVRGHRRGAGDAHGTGQRAAHGRQPPRAHAPRRGADGAVATESHAGAGRQRHVVRGPGCRAPVFRRPRLAEEQVRPAPGVLREQGV